MSKSTSSLWDSLPPAEQQAVKKRLAEAAKGAVPNPPKKGSFQLKGYLRCELSSADKDAFKEWESSLGEDGGLGLLVKEVDSGYLLKVGENGASYQASLCAATTGTAWEGYVLTAHAGAANRAAALLVFKHVVLMRRDWTPWLDEGNEDILR